MTRHLDLQDQFSKTHVWPRISTWSNYFDCFIHSTKLIVSLGDLLDCCYQYDDINLWKISQRLLQETFMSDCVSMIWIELSNHFSVTRNGQSNHFSATCFGHSYHFSVTCIGHGNQISMTTSTRMMKKKLKLRMKTRFVKIGTICIVILGTFYTI